MLVRELIAALKAASPNARVNITIETGTLAGDIDRDLHCVANDGDIFDLFVRLDIS